MAVPGCSQLIRVIASSFAVFALFLGTANAEADSRSAEAAVVNVAATPEPEEIVDALHAALLEVMQNAETLGYQGRFDELAGVVPGLFDTPFMAQKSVGRYWKRAAEEDRAHLLATFAKFMVANYAGNFDGYSGETFETLDKVESTHGTVVVRTRLTESSGDIIQLDYRLRRADEQWKIIDIYLNGTVSELALRRSEYSTLIEREGFDSLIVALNKKITDLSE